MFVAMHSTKLGPAGGGTRMKVYPTPAEGLRDAMRLAEAMTLKLAIAGAPRGGGKAVLAVPAIPQGEERRRLLHAYGDLLESLRGGFQTAPDVNTDDHDMDVISERTRYAFGRTVEAGGSGSSAPDTGVGVFHGIVAAVDHVFGSPDLAGRTVAVQGVGGVGGVLARLLADAGATVVVSDIDGARVDALAAEIGARVVPTDQVLTEECDVLSPCALGGILDAESIPALRCRIVAGAANNQLATPEDADRLHQRGILYAPDFVINAGGVLHVLGLEMAGWSREQVDDALLGIGRTLTEIFEAAESEGTTTEIAARRLAADRIDLGPTGLPGRREDASDP
jgi:leucine dehydrogenase